MTIKFELNDAGDSAYNNVTMEGRISRKGQRAQKLNCNKEERVPPANTYTANSETEKICEAIVSDFVRRFQGKYPESQFHNRLLIMAENEFGVSKCVCSTLKPTLLPYPSIHDSTECSHFVAHYLDYEPLKDPCQPPTLLPSPSQVLKWGVGDCFDLSIVLASFLTGAGYDAYVVYGTAPKWICDRDRSVQKSSFHENESPHTTEEQRNITKTLKELRSMIDENKPCGGDHKNRTVIDTQICVDTKDNIESGAVDPLHGKRIHCWILIKSNLRCPTGSTDYYIEPSTGHHFLPSSCPYQSIHAIWNSKNYWMNTRGKNNIQNVSLTVDVGWEAIFFNKDKENCQNNGDGCRMPFDPPSSWVHQLTISEDSFNFKYPCEGRRVVLYEKHKVELFSEGAQKHGIDKRVTMFEDKQMLCPVQCVEYFGKLRKDSLSMRVKLLQSHCFHELYSPLNQYSIKEWIALSGEVRLIKFHSKGRSDSLSSSTEKFGKRIVHTYEERRDRLSQRIIYLVWVEEIKAKMKKRLVIPSGDGAQNAIVTKIIEKYKRPLKCNGQSLHIASRSLCLKGKVLETQYFNPDGGIQKKKVTQSKRRDHNTTVRDDDDLIDHQRLNKAEKEMLTAVRNLHCDILDLLRARKRDEAPLRIDTFSESDNKKVITRPKAPRTSERNETSQMDVDYLSPYLVFVEDVNNISRDEALNIRDSCLTTMKERLLERANIIQNRLNEEQERLTQIQASYQQKLDKDSGSEEEFEKLCGEIAFKTKILERRLQEHEDSSLDKLKKLESKLQDDPRLNALYTNES